LKNPSKAYSANGTLGAVESVNCILTVATSADVTSWSYNMLDINGTSIVATNMFSISSTNGVRLAVYVCRVPPGAKFRIAASTDATRSIKCSVCEVPSYVFDDFSAFLCPERKQDEPDPDGSMHTPSSDSAPSEPEKRSGWVSVKMPTKTGLASRSTQ